jgi:hypothetical protein
MIPEFVNDQSWQTVCFPKTEPAVLRISDFLPVNSGGLYPPTDKTAVNLFLFISCQKAYSNLGLRIDITLSDKFSVSVKTVTISPGLTVSSVSAISFPNIQGGRFQFAGRFFFFRITESWRKITGEGSVQRRQFVSNKQLAK